MIERSKSPLRRIARGLVATATGLLAGALLAELLLSFLLFSETPAVVRATKSLRQPGRWASQRDESLFWELEAYWNGPTRRRLDPNFPDALLGWVNSKVAPETYEHRDDVVDAKRPILLYGDSFAQGLTPAASRFEGLFEDTEEAATHRFLNYGVGGYGVDQSYLLCKQSLDHYQGRDPLVIFSLLVDDDLDRALLDYRCWPKPRIELEDGRPIVTPPATTSGIEYFETESLRDGSWLVRYFESWKNPRRRRQSESAEAREEKQALFVALLRDLKQELEERDTEWFVLLFVGERAMQAPAPVDWREPFVLEALKELEIPFVITRPDLAEIGRRHLLRPEGLHIQRARSPPPQPRGQLRGAPDDAARSAWRVRPVRVPSRDLSHGHRDPRGTAAGPGQGQGGRGRDEPPGREAHRSSSLRERERRSSNRLSRRASRRSTS